MNREAHVRFCESVEVKLPRATHQDAETRKRIEIASELSLSDLCVLASWRFNSLRCQRRPAQSGWIIAGETRHCMPPSAIIVMDFWLWRVMTPRINSPWELVKRTRWPIR